MFIISVDNDNKICNLACNPSRKSKLQPIDNNGQRLYELSCNEIIRACILIKKNALYFNPENRDFYNEKGEVMFNANNGNSSTYLVNDKSKEYVCKIDKNKAKQFLDSLILIKNEEIRYNEIKNKLDKQLFKVNQAVTDHIAVLENIHDEMAKELAMSNYNEFKHKIHLDEDGSLYIIPKQTQIELSDLVKDEED